MMRSLGWLTGCIGRQLRGRVISVEQPYFPSCEITQQFLILSIAHVARPDNLGMVNICCVVNPLPVHIVTRAIVHDDQVPNGRVLQFTHDGRTVQVSPWPGGLDLSMRGYGGD